MPATSKAQFRYMAAHPDKFPRDEWLKGVKYGKLPEHVKKASAAPAAPGSMADWALPVGGALGGAVLGKMWRDKQDPEDDGVAPILAGAAAGGALGYGGSALMNSLEESALAKRHAEAQQVIAAAKQHGVQENPLERGGFRYRGYAVNGDQLDQAAHGQAPQVGPDAEGWHRFSTKGRWKPSEPTGNLGQQIATNQTNAQQAERLGFPDVQNEQNQLGNVKAWDLQNFQRPDPQMGPPTPVFNPNR